MPCLDDGQLVSPIVDRVNLLTRNPRLRYHYAGLVKGKGRQVKRAWDLLSTLGFAWMTHCIGWLVH